MIIDNITSQMKAHEWLQRYRQPGTLNIVTGYFTVGALAYLADLLNDHIQAFKIVLGDIVHTEQAQERPLDLLNENISVEAALQLSTTAKRAAAFLRQAKVLVKTLEPNFCHAKAYLFHHDSNLQFDHCFLTGSSNLTEAGIGLKATQNVELNIGGQGTDSDYKELKTWFETLWSCPQAHDDKLADGKRIPFKTYLLREIEKLFATYTPKDLYYKVLFELFGNQVLEGNEDPEFNRQLGRLENTAIYNALYDFQRKGAMSLIRMLQKHNGAILADAVGLGKTWTALAVMKFFQLEGRQIFLLCPKKLEQNWRQYQVDRNSRFEADQLHYIIRFHTDLQETRLEKDGRTIARHFQSDRPKLLVIDESHNLRNAKSSRYKFLVETLLKGNDDIKVLMLSATPINNTLLDVRNQFKLMVKDDPRGFRETLDIQNIDATFRTAQQAFHEWRQQEQRTIGEFIKRLPANFFKLTDALTLARTRKMIAGQVAELAFPVKAKPINLFVTPKQIGHFDTFEEMFESFPPMLSGYQPSFYVEQAGDIKALENERLRDRFLVKMMYILMVKRLESSWFACRSTVEKILAHHENALRKIDDYLAQPHPQPLPKGEAGLLSSPQNPTPTLPEGEGVSPLLRRGAGGEVRELNSPAKGEGRFVPASPLERWPGGEVDSTPDSSMFDDEDGEDADEFTLGKRRPVKLADIARAGNLEAYRLDLKQDIAALDRLHSNLARFQQALDAELRAPRNHQSRDTKLEALMAQIQQKRQSGCNGGNQKVLIFTVFKDTAFYLFEQLKQRGFQRLAVVSGSESQTDDAEACLKDFEPILERFAPYTKLFKEKEWPGFSPHPPAPSEIPLSFGEGAGGRSDFECWKIWVSERNPHVKWQLEHPIDLLIATDCLSEGQNLQDCDFVVNYDIHWNPVRVIQRMGRIDRLGSPNSAIYGVNFWPSENINAYLNLQDRIENRMITMRLAGAEVDKHFTDTLAARIEDEQFEQAQNARMLEQMQVSWEDIEVSDQSLGFENLSLEAFRQDLAAELRSREDFYRNMPKGLYTGFRKHPEICAKDGIIALLGYPAKPGTGEECRYAAHDLIYIDNDGHAVILNQQGVLEALAQHKDLPRSVPDAVDYGEPDAIAALRSALTTYLRTRVKDEEIPPEGAASIKMGTSARDVLEKLKRGDLDAVKRLKQHETIEETFQPERVELIAWFVVN